MTPAEWAFLRSYYMDRMNACTHMLPVGFSQLTQELGNHLEVRAGHRPDLARALDEVKSGRHE